MLKRSVNIFLILIIALGSVSDVFAKGGRSYSSGSKSSSSSFKSSSSSSSKGSSYSSGAKSKGSSYSFSPSTPTTPKTSQTPQTPKYSSGSTPSTPKYSSGSTPSTPKYSSGSTPTPTATPSFSSNNSRKPTSSSFNGSISKDAKLVESQKVYQAAVTPKSTYTSKGSDGKVTQQTIKPDSPQVQSVRRNVTHERYVTYDNRSNSFYGGFGSPMYYHDPFSPFLMGWIMSDAINSSQRAQWMYHHQSDMDQERYSEMLKKDAKLQAEIDQLKAQNVPRDPSYVPPQMSSNPDLMYNKEFVDASYNPVPVSAPAPVPVSAPVKGISLFFAFCVVFSIVLIGLIVYYFFVKDF